MAIRRKVWFCAIPLALTSASAGAMEVCVKCSGPDASYACVVNAASGGQLDTAANLYCITALAKAGPHASCSIDRATRAPCQGERRELPIPAGLEDAITPNDQDTAAPGPQPGLNESTIEGASLPPGARDATQPLPEHAEAPPQVDQNSKPPKTVQEIVENSSQSASGNSAMKTAGTALQKAGSAVGDAAKTSWKCLSSFFSKC